MNDEKIEKAKGQLGAYGYTLTDAFQIEKGGKIFSVVVSAKGPRFYVKQLSGAPLWSGPDLGEFVKSFWYAKKVEPMVPNGSYAKIPGVRGRFEMVRTSRDPGRAGMHQYGAATVWVSGPAGGTWWATVKFRNQEKDLGKYGNSYESVLQEAADWVDAAPELSRNGRGIYHETAAGKNDMVLHQDHRGSWRIDLVTSAGGNHTDVTGRGAGRGPNSGYGSAEEAFQAALDVQRIRGIRGKSHVFIADRDGNLSDYEPMEANGRMDPRTGATVPSPMFSAGDRVERDDGSARGEVAIVGNYDETIGGYRYKVQQDNGARIYWNESSTRHEGHSPNGRATTVDPVAARELDLYIANTYELVGDPTSIGKSIDANLKRKLASGKYDSALAPKAWQHLVDEGAKRYQKEFGSDSPIFNAATRRQVAEDFARAWEEENGMRANGVTNETNLRQAIIDALHQRSRKHLEIWRTVSQRYPSTVYADFDALMGKMEMDGTITLTGSRGPNTYKLT